jgi:manganese/iron transport system ATP-binding protein
MYPHIGHELNQPVLDVRNLTFQYSGKPAIEDITFHLHKGENVAVVGPNGAGKSTLFKVIAGVLTPTMGEVNIFGAVPEKHVCIAFIPQRSQVDWHFPVSVADVVMMGRSAKLKLFTVPSKKDWSIVNESLEKVELSELANRQIGQLSGGQQQRMFIARALAQEAELVLMDEPLSGLDIPAQTGLLGLLEKLKKEQVTVMVATHDLEQAAQYFDEILLLNHKLFGFGDASTVLTSENLLAAYAGRLKMVNGAYPNTGVDESCCEGGEDQ